MKTDVHVHVFPPHVIGEVDKYLERDAFLKEICSSPVHKYATVDDLLQEMDKCGIEKAAVSGFASSDEGLCREMNDYVLEAAKSFPSRLFPMAIVSMREGNIEKELSRSFEQGAVGVGELFPWGQNFSLYGKEAEVLASFCEEKNIPLLLHVNENVGHNYVGKGDVSVKEAYDFAARHPELKIIYAHLGGGLLFYELMPEVKKQLKNVYYDTAAGPFLYNKAIYRVFREMGIMDKVLLGTDYPLISPRRYLRELQEAGLSGEEEDMITSSNAHKLLFCS